MGYLISSICLKLYIAPGLTPIIDNKNPRWLGAWWLGEYEFLTRRGCPFAIQPISFHSHSLAAKFHVRHRDGVAIVAIIGSFFDFSSRVPKFCILLTTRTYCMDVVDSHQLRNFFPRQFKLLLLSSSSAFVDPRLPRAYSYVY